MSTFSCWTKRASTWWREAGGGPTGRQLVGDGFAASAGFRGWLVAYMVGKPRRPRRLLPTMPRWYSVTPQAGDRPVAPEIAVPMRLAGRMIGLLEVGSSEVDAFAVASSASWSRLWPIRWPWPFKMPSSMRQRRRSLPADGGV